MSTSVLGLAEKIVLPFTAVVAFGVCVLGYWLWHFQRQHRENITQRMSIWFTATSAALMGQVLFHSIPNATDGDYTLYIAFAAIGFIPLVCMEKFWSSLQFKDDDILLNRWNELSDYTHMDSQEEEESGADIDDAATVNKRRRVIAVMTYIIILFQSSVDGLMLKYNPNGQEPGTQIGMFFLAKILESVIVSSAMIHAAPKIRYYWTFSLNFAIAVGLSTVAAYDLVDPLIIVMIVEHWIFKMVLGVSAGVLLWLSIRFHVLDPGTDLSTRRKLTLCGTYIAVMAMSYATGKFG